MTSAFFSVLFGPVGLDIFCDSQKAAACSCSAVRSFREISPAAEMRERLTLTFVSAEASEETAAYLQLMPDDLRPMAEICRRAWARTVNFGAAPEAGKEGSLLRDWRGLLSKLEVIVPHLGVYRRRECGDNHFFCFLPSFADSDSFSGRMIDVIYLLGIYWHGLRGGLGCLHGSAVVRQGRGFVFLGPGGAGKSTAALLGLEAGGQIIDDDILCVAGEGEQDYAVLSPRAWGAWVYKGKRPMPRFAEVGLGVPLAGIFVLAKAGEDRLVPLSNMAAAYALTRQALGLEGNNQLRMPENIMRRVFENCCTIAERVPAYQLYFRKSPDFWKLIDDTLGN